MKINILFSIILFFCLIGCSTSKEEIEIDPFAEIQYGKTTFENVKAKFLTDARFSNPKYDSTEFRYFLRHKEDVFPIIIELNPDDYNFGALREIRIELDGDTMYSPEPVYFQGSGPRLKSEVDRIIEIYQSNYGPPDSIFIKEEAANPFGQSAFLGSLISASQTALRGDDLRNKEIDTIKERSLIWEFENFSIDFYLPKPYLSKYKNKLPVYYGARILYSMKNYDQTYSAIKDSIRSALVPNEIISVDLGEIKWVSIDEKGDRKIDVEIRGFSRKAMEITEGFRAVRYDIHITDQFNKVIGEINNLTYEFDETVLRPPEGALTFWMSSPHIIKTYNLYSPNYDSLEKARQYSENFRVRVVANVKAVVLGGGEVIE